MRQPDERLHVVRVRSSVVTGEPHALLRAPTTFSLSGRCHALVVHAPFDPAGSTPRERGIGLLTKS
jgi:hypothetical protein